MAGTTGSVHTVFVYGTLKKGQPNEYVMKDLVSSIEYFGKARTKQAYPLIISGEWNLPMLLNAEGKGKNVKGELYKVNDKDLKRLDDFEGHPNMYERLKIDVTTLPENTDGEMTLRCWTYFIKSYTEEELGLEFFDNYDSAGSHGLAYDTRENDDIPDQV